MFCARLPAPLISFQCFMARRGEPLPKDVKLTEEDAIRYSRHLLSALRDMHSVNLVHLDVKGTA